jgi:hypothetical protein
MSAISWLITNFPGDDGRLTFAYVAHKAFDVCLLSGIDSYRIASRFDIDVGYNRCSWCITDRWRWRRWLLNILSC